MTKSENVESFFNFFQTKKAPEEDDSEGDPNEEKEKLIEDFEKDMRIADEFTNELIPRAIYYFLALVDEDDSESDQNEQAEEEEDNTKASKNKREKIDKLESKQVLQPASKKECKQQ